MTESFLSSYKLSPEMQEFLKRWVTLHRVLWVLTLIIFFVAWNRGLALLYGLFSLLVALLVISYVMPKWQLRNIRVTRQSISDLTAGKPGSITYILESNRTGYHIELIERLEFAENKDQYIFFNKISGRKTWKMQFNCLRRGCYWLKECRLVSAYPFGIIQSSKTCQLEPVEILVFPRVVDLTRIPLPGVADTTTLGAVLIPKYGGKDEFAAVREYSQGDELNRIHWSISARHQNLFVKVYEKTDRPSMLVVLDCSPKFNVGEDHESTFEYAVSIAASMIRFAIREGIQCFLAADSGHVIELTVHPFSTDLFPFYRALARLSCNGKLPYHSLVEQAHRRFPQANLIATFRLDNGWTQPVLSPRVTQIDLEMDVKSFLTSKKQSVEGNRGRREGNRLIYSVCANQKLENLFL